MVCPDKKPKGKLHVYFNGKDMGEVEPYIQTDELEKIDSAEHRLRSGSSIQE